MELFFLAMLIVLMAGALASGYPVAFALPGSAIVTIVVAAACGYLFAGSPDAYFAQGGPSQWLSAGVTNLRGVYWEVERDTLIAIPLFIFMGIMLQRSKIAEDLLLTMAQLFGPVPGGLGISVIFVGALLAATTGILGATVVAMGLISLPAMLRNNYSKSLATGTIAASGTLGQIIPPSIVLIILADQLASAVDQAGTSRQNFFKEVTGELTMPSEFGVVSTSAGEMFLGAFVPGLVLVGLYMSYVLILALIRPKFAPAVPREGAFDKQFLIRVVVTLVPPLTLIFLVLGSIISGVATVNQAGAIGAAGALLMAGYRLMEGERGAFRPAMLAAVALVIIAFAVSTYDTNIKNITTGRDAFGVVLALVAVGVLIVALIWSGWRTLKIDNTMQGVMLETAKTTSLVFIILLGAAMLTAAFRAFGGEDIVRHYLHALPGGFWSQFIIVMAVIFLLGFFLDFIEIAVVVVPIVAPILLADPSANITAVWLGVMIGLNIQTSFLTPPFGFALFYLRGVAPAIVRTLDMYKGVIAFICLQLVALAIVGYYPRLVNYLPNRISFTAETAPPPRNPKLQYCLEEFVAEQFESSGAAIDKAIATIQGVDLTSLPEKLRTRLSASFKEAATVRALLDEAFAKQKIVDAESKSYRVVHTEVRDIEKRIRAMERIIGEIESDLARGIGDVDRARERIARLHGDIDTERANIPLRWEDAHKQFSVLQLEERKARTAYRRAADSAYEPVAESIAVIEASSALESLRPAFSELQQAISSRTPDEAVELYSALSGQLAEVPGAGDIKQELRGVRRALKAAEPDLQGALDAITATLGMLDQEVDWRSNAGESLLAELRAYDATIRDTIGARLQPTLSREQALFLAACSAGHRDISLNF